MAITGKNGSSATYKAMKRIALVQSHYGPKFIATLGTFVSEGVISSADSGKVQAFLSDVPALLAILKKVDDNSGF